MPVPAGLRLHQTATLDLRTCLRRNPSNLWTPTSQRSVEFGNSAAPENVIYAGQGPPPPSPMVVERFQQVISQLFQQVSGHILQLQRSTLPPACILPARSLCRHQAAAMSRTLCNVARRPASLRSA
jgi:hypothetical protein